VTGGEGNTEDAISQRVRALVSAADAAGERSARLRQDTRHRARTSNAQEAREMSSQIDADRQAAMAQLGDVYRSAWWDHATPEQIASTFRTARAWAGEEPEAVRSITRIGEELHTRFGINIGTPASEST
jgi:hypothetical protein